jgi:carbon-monoxide dehydrogenase small subunit
MAPVTTLEVQITVNGVARSVQVAVGQTLLAVLREQFRLTSVKEGCGQGDCGACVVVMDGDAVNSCLVLASQADGTNVTTLEGLSDANKLHPLQQAFVANWAFQCGFCTPGMIMSCYALLLHNPKPSPAEVREAIAGNLCRCTSYRSIVEAVLDAAALPERKSECDGGDD